MAGTRQGHARRRKGVGRCGDRPLPPQGPHYNRRACPDWRHGRGMRFPLTGARRCGGGWAREAGGVEGLFEGRPMSSAAETAAAERVDLRRIAGGQAGHPIEVCLNHRPHPPKPGATHQRIACAAPAQNAAAAPPSSNRTNQPLRTGNQGRPADHRTADEPGNPDAQPRRA
ncbi:hypothetical protein XCR_3734 [Xanthomonas campestris pv. raphani 756C]|nr:hypothetical protein XCR_3734 [Xanthomonas campestris pv. raphani 756C]